MHENMEKMMTSLLQRFAEAWNNHDIDTLMALMTEDCVFESSFGEEVCGRRYEGREAVRDGFSQAWINYPDARWNDPRHFVHGDRGVSEWTFTGTDNNGMRSEVAGCDLFTFRDGQIAVKNSFRKHRPLVRT